MKLDDYLKAIENCSDEFVKIKSHSRDFRWVHKLTSDFGVYDNWPILLKEDFDKVVEHLQNSNYRIGKTFKNGKKTNHQFFYVPGTVELQVMGYAPTGLDTVDFTEEGKLHSQRQEKDFNMRIVLHPYQDKKIENILAERTLALVIKDIGMYAQEKRIPLCFPNSIGWQNIGDLSKIVYYP